MSERGSYNSYILASYAMRASENEKETDHTAFFSLFYFNSPFFYIMILHLSIHVRSERGRAGRRKRERERGSERARREERGPLIYFYINL
jgi:hypothetical protein